VRQPIRRYFPRTGSLSRTQRRGREPAERRRQCERIRAASGLDAVGAVVYVAAAVQAPGHIQHFGRGDLVIGRKNGTNETAGGSVARCGVPCRVSNNIRRRALVKFIANCALNPSRRSVKRSMAGSPTARRRQIAGDGRRRSAGVARAGGHCDAGGGRSRAALAISMKIATQMREQIFVDRTRPQPRQAH